MVSQEALRGYVLEEFIARLVRDSGYDLLVHPSQDPFALTTKSNELNILGRGAQHQVDVLGQLRTQIPLTYPLRMFIEVKFRNGKTGLPTLRNALGVLNDVNEHYSWRAADKASTTARYDYRYAIFSTSGFTDDAIQYAITQRLSLGDLSTAAFRWLRDAADKTAAAILDLAKKHGGNTVRVRQVRMALRKALGTMPSGIPLSILTGLPGQELREIAEAAAERIDSVLYLAFATDSPFIVFLQPDEPEDANDFLSERVEVRLQDERLEVARSGTGEWLVTTDSARQTMTLRLAVPEGLAPWVVAEPIRYDTGNEDVVTSARQARPRSLLIAATGGALAELTFEPVRLPRSRQESTKQDVGASWQRPDLAYHDEGTAAEPEGSAWNLEAFDQLLRRLRGEGAVQAAVIEAAARRRGRLTRGQAYRVAGYESERSLRGFTRPARRITRRLIREGLLPSEAKWPLEAYYAGRSVRATHLAVPTEFTGFIRQLDS